MKKDYRVVSCNLSCMSLHHFEIMVHSYLQKGYEVVGGVSKGDDDYIYQAIIKNNVSEDKENDN